MRKRAEEDKARIRGWLPIVVSLAALSVSLVNLYVTNFRPARVQAKAGEYFDFGLLREGNFYASIPVALSNVGSRTAVVTRMALFISANQGQEGYLLEPLDYQRINERGFFAPESAAAPITLKGGDNVVKQVRFRSPIGKPAPLQIYGPGKHDLALIAWLDNADDPVVLERFAINVTETAHANIKNALDQNAQQAPDDPNRVSRDERVAVESRGRLRAGPLDENTAKKLGGS